MDLQQLRTFVAIAQQGSLTRASVKLCLSQPAISAQIKGLEEELNVKLFDRTARGMLLTLEGRELLDEANKTLIAANNVSVAARKFQNGGVRGEFRLGTISDPTILRLDDFFSTLSVRHPEVLLSLSQGISGEILDRVLERRIHAGYVIGTISHPDLECLEISRVTLRVVAPVAFEDTLRRADWPDIVKLPWISTPKKCSFHHIALKMFLAHNVAPQSIVESDQETTLVNLVAAGVGLTLVREDVASAAQRAGKLIIWAPGMEISSLNFIYLRSEKSAPLTQAILALVSEMWRLPPQVHTA